MNTPRPFWRRPAWAVLLVIGSAGIGAAADNPPAAFAWQTATPESQGLATAKLDAFKEGLAARSTIALLVVRNDRIVYEWYAPGTSATTHLGTASAAKGLVGGLATAVAINDGLITLDARAAQFIPQWRDDPLKSKITIRELGSHTSGLDDAEHEDIAHEKLTGWQGDFWKRLPVPHDPFTIARDLTPMLTPPGERDFYSNPGIAMLVYAVTASLRNSQQRDFRTLLRDRVMRVIGVRDGEWEVGYGQTFTVDGLPLVAAWGGGSFTARGMARIGLLMLHEGVWDGQRILSRAAVHAVTDDAGTPGSGAIGWWSNNDGQIPSMPRDAYYASGAGHKVVVVIPSLHVVAVRNGQLLSTAEEYTQSERRHFFDPLMVALGSN